MYERRRPGQAPASQEGQGGPTLNLRVEDGEAGVHGDATGEGGVEEGSEKKGFFS